MRVLEYQCLIIVSFQPSASPIDDTCTKYIWNVFLEIRQLRYSEGLKKQAQFLTS